MTYSPVKRIGERRSDGIVDLIEPRFLERLPGLDWLSARLPCRHWAYLLECVATGLAMKHRRWPPEAVARAAELLDRILAQNGLFDFKLPGPPAFRWAHPVTPDMAGPSLVYTLQCCRAMRALA